MLDPEKTTGGGLFVPGKDRVVFRAPERKSLLGIDAVLVILWICYFVVEGSVMLWMAFSFVR